MTQSTLLEHIEQLPDPRQPGKCRHLFSEVIFMTICGLLCGADDWNGIEFYAKTNEKWFRRYLKLPNGIPAHDTFNRLFSLLDPKSFHELFTHWVQETLVNTELCGVVAIDGKTQRGSRSHVLSEISHTVNAWSTELGVCLGQEDVDGKSNEITAVPKLLERLALKGCLVTADAMSCQKKIAQQIIRQEADYLLAVKKNQKTLYKAIDDNFMNYWHQCPEDSPSDQHFTEETGMGHNRKEHRRCWVFPVPDEAPFKHWKAKMMVAIQYDRETNHKKSSDVRYFITSRIMSAEAVLQASRQHWQVENSLHWVLDVAFNEDLSRARKGFAAKNLATARQIALNLLKQDTTVKIGIKNKRKGCGWSKDYLCHILGLIS